MTVPQPGISTLATVVSVQDGDTLEVEITRRLRVRLLDCWSPERNTAIGQRAKRYLEKLANGKHVLLFIPAGQRTIGEAFTFDRVLGHLWIDGMEESVSELLVKEGHASTRKQGKLGE